MVCIRHRGKDESCFEGLLDLVWNDFLDILSSVIRIPGRDEKEGLQDGSRDLDRLVMVCN